MPERRNAIIARAGHEGAGALPCPVLSALVIDGHLRPGPAGELTRAQVDAALEHLGLTTPLRWALELVTALATRRRPCPRTYRLYALYESFLDHAGTVGPLHGGAFHPDALERLLAFSTDGRVLTLADIAVALTVRMREDDATSLEMTMGRAEWVAFYLVFEQDGGVPVATVDRLFRDGGLPEAFTANVVDVGAMRRAMGELGRLEASTEVTDRAAAALAP